MIITHIYPHVPAISTASPNPNNCFWTLHYKTLFAKARYDITTPKYLPLYLLNETIITK